MVDLVPVNLRELGMSEVPDARLIGLELRIQTHMSGVEELQMLPLEIVIPGRRRQRFGGDVYQMPCTLHTSVGDIAFTIPLHTL